MILLFLFCASFAFAYSKKGQLNIFSKTGKTYNVFLDDKSVGKTPLKLQDVLSGTHYLRIVDSESFRTAIDKTISIKEEEQNTILVEQEMQAITQNVGTSAPNIENKSDTDKLIEYNSESKNSWIAVGAAWLLPSLGHAYAGDWGRGFPFLFADVGCIALMASGFSTGPLGRPNYSTTYIIGALGLIVARVWEYFDAYSTAEENNNKLKIRLGVSSINGLWATSLKQNDLLTISFGL